METTTKKRPNIDELRRRLSNLRNDSLIASRKSDFRTVARLTIEAASINRILSEYAD